MGGSWFGDVLRHRKEENEDEDEDDDDDCTISEDKLREPGR